VAAERGHAAHGLLDVLAGPDVAAREVRGYRAGGYHVDRDAALAELGFPS
jgi:hypothetical protein